VTRTPSSILLAGALFLAGSAAAQTLPVADAGDDQNIPCAPPAGAEVVLDGTGSSDPDDPLTVLTYTWTGDALGVGVSVDGATPTVTLPPGVHVLTLSVDDVVDGTDSDEVTITVVADSEPPQLVLATETAELWPPNHKYHAFDAADLVASVSDSCDTEMSAADVVFARGTSDEADNANGDGNTTGDVAFDVGCMTALLRSERAGPGDGRVYELTLEARDAAGNPAEALFTVSVPHDRAHAAVDSGDVVEVVGECLPVEMCPPTPSETCESAPEAGVRIEDRGKHGMSLRWRARGFAAAEGEFSDESTDYQLCVYTEEGDTATLEDDPAAPHGRGWKHGKKGASFKGHKAGHAARLDALKLGQKKGSGALSVSASGDDVDLPALPLPAGASLTLQLHDSEAGCVGSEFSDPEVNDGDSFADEVEGD
jgi:hypothetical protein